MEQDAEPGCTGFFTPSVEDTMSCLDQFQANSMVGFVSGNILEAFYNFGHAIIHPANWLAWGNPEALARFMYYGGSVEFFFFLFTIFLIVTGIGIWKRQFLWNCVRGLEFFGNWTGRIFAWAGLIMVLQQIIIVFSQRIFNDAAITLGFNTRITFDVSWWSEELKLYNAMIVCLCVSYTFIQGGHVRVDLVYAAVKHRTKRAIDMFGALFFMMPAVVLTWLYAWFFMWRHLVVPNPNAGASLDRMLTQARALRWNVETTGFSPNGFSAYFLFKMLIVAYCALVFIQAIAFFWRSYLEWVEGEESAGKYIDKDSLDDPEAELAAAIH